MSLLLAYVSIALGISFLCSVIGSGTVKRHTGLRQRD